MRREGLDTPVEEVTHVDAMGRLRRATEGRPAHAIPGLEVEVGEHPRVGGVAGGIEQAASHDPVIHVVPARPTPTVAVVDSEEHLGAVPPDRRSYLSAQFEALLQQSIGQAEELELVDTDDLT